MRAMSRPADTYPSLRAMEETALFRHLGFRFTAAGDGWAELTFTASDRTANLYGMVHGGVWLFLADSAMGGALSTAVEPGQQVITTQLDFRWLRALQGDTILARGRVLRQGRTVAHMAVDLAEDGETIGTGSATYAIVDRRS